MTTKSTNKPLMFLVILATICATIATAQTTSRTTTLLPSKEMVLYTDGQTHTASGFAPYLEEQKIKGGRKINAEALYLNFDLSGISPSAGAVSFTLRLRFKEEANKRKDRKQNFNVFDVADWKDSLENKQLPVTLLNSIVRGRARKAGNTVVNIDTSIKAVTTSTDSVLFINIRLNIDSVFRKSHTLSLLVTGDNNHCCQYFTAAQDNNNFSKRYLPRLTVEYADDAHYCYADWLLADADAQHSRHSQWRANGKVTGWDNVQFVAMEAPMSVAPLQPLVCNGDVIMPCQSFQDGFFLQKYETGKKGILAATSAGLGANVFGSPFAINHQHQLLYPHDTSTIDILDVDNRFSKVASFMVEPGNNTNSDINLLPASDGSTYITTTKGIYAFTPDHKLKWKFHKNGVSSLNYSAPVLSSNEARMYVIFKNEHILFTIDNTSGTIIRKTMLDRMVDGPVTLQYHAQSGKVLAKVPTRQGQYIMMMDSLGNVFDVTSDGNHKYSPPALTADGLYFVEDTTLKYYALLGTMAGKMITCAKPSFDDKTSLVTDGSNRLFALNNHYAAQSIAALTLVGDKILQESQTVLDTATFGNISSKLCLLPDGSLLAGNSNKQWSLRPIYEVDNEIPHQPEDHRIYNINSNTVFASSTVIKSATNVTINMYGCSTLPDSFIVQQGGRVTIKEDDDTKLQVDANGHVSTGSSHAQAVLDIAKQANGLVLPQLSREEILKSPNPIEGTMCYDKSTGKAAYYNGRKWVYADGGQVEYKIGDTVEDGIVFYVTDSGTHGKIVRNRVMDSVYFHMAPKCGDLFPLTTSDALGKENTKQILQYRRVQPDDSILEINLALTVTIEKYKVGFYPVDTARKYNEMVWGGLANILQLYNRNKTDTIYKWYVPSKEEALQVAAIAKTLPFQTENLSIWTSTINSSFKKEYLNLATKEIGNRLSDLINLVHACNISTVAYLNNNQTLLTKENCNEVTYPLEKLTKSLLLIRDF